jgi:hypothetical protein
MITILTREDDICDDVKSYFPAMTGTKILMHYETVQNLDTLMIKPTDF